MSIKISSCCTRIDSKRLVVSQCFNYGRFMLRVDQVDRKYSLAKVAFEKKLENFLEVNTTPTLS